MTTRDLRFGLYADEEGLALVEGIVRRAVEPRSARILRWSVARTVVDGGLTTAYLYDHLAEQWAVENPGRAGGARRPVELHVRLACSLRTWRAIRKTVIRDLCPEGTAPHTCRVPWSAW
ncbi:hypothetical protein [Streptomyces echinatus]|uniref:Uncharacterized protein n=1 Tax=Streptomyces echinatus TaxID=67293 RepID=A0A7W9USS2_9ACTN|nr:hypothetical protein [Streptomyces echinatus]MBB5929807.1 hypothetical protein [Streptomyces echinatus]